ncbi:DUF488 domain-containing protein [Nodosilinea sp. LEGE 07298]|uniref:DUF488 domain-containing protein n=1 Tax=Nodosilinea sp. LEGE 07298 TaxID=2777970 RepID=UPI001881A5C8|nr:DUF488 domain-containing protein [Nodosilinea sp. LEGE 07298]MBE9109989.1 DUF488 domain-containing protein [Nodosilinea sp. LEGE 07298]
MLHRQKALLEILQQVGGQATTLQLMKWAFLLGQETQSRGGKTFYQFIPYRYGPYSFTLNRETDTLVRNGFMEKTADKVWQLTTVGKEQEVKLPKTIAQDITAVTQQYGSFSSSALIDTVYANYPWFTVNSDLPGKRQEHRPIADQAIYTAGYEGKTVDEFLNLLMRSGIRRLVDVRYNPISRRYGFHKSTLHRLCNALDIDYQHLPGLGIPGSARADLSSTDSYIALFKEYRCGLSNRWDDLQKAMSLLKSEPSVLVCMEANPECCHRTVLAQHLEGMMKLPIKHLG